jgi:hypothetical protein
MPDHAEAAPAGLQNRSPELFVGKPVENPDRMCTLLVEPAQEQLGFIYPKFLDHRRSSPICRYEAERMLTPSSSRCVGVEIDT